MRRLLRPTCITCGIPIHYSAQKCSPHAASDRARRSWVTRRANLDARFWDRVDQSGGSDACHPWMGSRTHYGYGFILREGHRIAAHRRALELSLGRPIGAGLQALHRCDNPPCCNPAHLFEGSNADNHADKVAKRRHARGERHGSARLTSADVAEIRRRRALGESIASVAADFPVGEQTVQRIGTYRAWAS